MCASRRRSSSATTAACCSRSACRARRMRATGNFPGGKLESGESPRDALRARARRGARASPSCAPCPGSCSATTIRTPTSSSISFACSSGAASPRGRDGQAIAWQAPGAIRRRAAAARERRRVALAAAAAGLRDLDGRGARRRGVSRAREGRHRTGRQAHPVAREILHGRRDLAPRRAASRPGGIARRAGSAQRRCRHRAHAGLRRRSLDCGAPDGRAREGPIKCCAPHRATTPPSLRAQRSSASISWCWGRCWRRRRMRTRVRSGGRASRSWREECPCPSTPSAAWRAPISIRPCSTVRTASRCGAAPGPDDQEVPAPGSASSGSVGSSATGAR